jgi:hypothetical protein
MPKGFRFPAMAEYAVFIQGLSDAATDISQLPDRTRLAAHRAVNYAAARGRTQASRRMREQVAWTASYLDGKLKLRPAVGDETEAAISATFRPTSLARFATGSKTPWTYAKQLRVATGDARFVGASNKMIFVPLKAGTAAISEDNQNIGLAVRLKDGETVKGKYKVKPIGRGLYLLYGPSASQVFYTVAEDIIPDVTGWLDQEFNRQINRKDN